jgi:hypothetical protein
MLLLERQVPMDTMRNNPLSLSVCTSTGDLDALGREWGQLHAAAQGSVFQSFAWNRFWWDLYAGSNDLLRIAGVRDGDTLIGILPVYLMSSRVGPLTIVQLRFLGTSDTYGEYGPLVMPGREDDAAGMFAEFCASELRNGRCDVVSFFRFPPGSVVVGRMLDRFREYSFSLNTVPFVIPRMLMELPATWEEYFNSLTESEQKMLHRRTKALLHKGVQVEVVTDFRKDPTAFSDFVDLHSRAWADEGLPGYYKNSPRFLAFHRKFISETSPDGSARIYFMVSEGVRFAAVQAFFVGKSCCFYLSGMDRRHPLANQSPGKVLLSIVIGDAIREGCVMFDFQGGDEDYKRRLGGEMTSFAKAQIWIPGKNSFKVGVLRTLQAVRYSLVTILYGDIIVRFSRRFLKLVGKG